MSRKTDINERYICSIIKKELKLHFVEHPKNKKKGNVLTAMLKLAVTKNALFRRDVLSTFNKSRILKMTGTNKREQNTKNGP